MESLYWRSPLLEALSENWCCSFWVRYVAQTDHSPLQRYLRRLLRVLDSFVDVPILIPVLLVHCVDL